MHDSMVDFFKEHHNGPSTDTSAGDGAYCGKSHQRMMTKCVLSDTGAQFAGGRFGHVLAMVRCDGEEE